MKQLRRCFIFKVDERPTDNYLDIGGLDKQIEELIEAIVLPMKHKDKFDVGVVFLINKLLKPLNSELKT